MPHLHLHLENHNGLEPDPEGREFANEQMAIVEAARAIGATMWEDVGQGIEPVTVRIMVDRADGTRVATLVGQLTVDRTGG